MFHCCKVTMVKTVRVTACHSNDLTKHLSTTKGVWTIEVQDVMCKVMCRKMYKV